MEGEHFRKPAATFRDHALSSSPLRQILIDPIAGIYVTYNVGRACPFEQTAHAAVMVFG
jgi:hypothetical protein